MSEIQITENQAVQLYNLLKNAPNQLNALTRLRAKNLIAQNEKEKAEAIITQYRSKPDFVKTKGKDTVVRGVDFLTVAEGYQQLKKEYEELQAELNKLNNGNGK